MYLNVIRKAKTRAAKMAISSGFIGISALNIFGKGI